MGLSWSTLLAVQKLTFQSWLSLTNLGKSFYFSVSVSWRSEEFVPAAQPEVQEDVKPQNTNKTPSWLLSVPKDFGVRRYFYMTMNTNVFQ